MVVVVVGFPPPTVPPGIVPPSIVQESSSSSFGISSFGIRRPVTEEEASFSKRARATDGEDDDQIDKILESRVRNPYKDEESPVNAKRGREDPDGQDTKARRIDSLQVPPDDDVVDINLVECRVNPFESAVVKAMDDWDESCFEQAYDDVNGGVLPIHLVKKERHAEVSFMVDRNIWSLRPFLILFKDDLYTFTLFQCVFVSAIPITSMSYILI